MYYNTVAKPIQLDNATSCLFHIIINICPNQPQQGILPAIMLGSPAHNAISLVDKYLTPYNYL